VDPSRLLPPNYPLFGSASPFNRSIVEDNLQVHPDSDGIIGKINADIIAADKKGRGLRDHMRLQGGVAGTANDWNHPLYVAQSSDPLYTIVFSENWGTAHMGPDGMKVRIPDGAIAATGSDHHFGVLDLAKGYETDFWDVQKIDTVARRITASWGGRLPLGGTGCGTLGPTGKMATTSGATAAGFALSAGVIRPSELIAAKINHALFLVVRGVKGFKPPAVGNAHQGSGNYLPANGQRLGLDMSLSDIAALPQPPAVKAVLEAMATKGMFIGDTGGGGVLLESSQPYLQAGQTDPMIPLLQSLGCKPSTDPAYKGIYTLKLGDVIDWSQLRVFA
jgi:hypothetical protein